MRGLWDNEQPLSPAVLKSALALVGAFLALCAIVMLIISVASVADGNYAAAAMQLSAGVALPFGIWLSLRMFAEMLRVLNQSHDRMASIEEAQAGRAATMTPTVYQAGGPVTGRASDDGPAYPEAEGPAA